MTTYVQDAQKFKELMLKMRRKLVDGALMQSQTTLVHLQHLAIVNDSIGLASAIIADETTRAQQAEVAKHEAANTLVDDGMGNIFPPSGKPPGMADLESVIKARRN